MVYQTRTMQMQELRRTARQLETRGEFREHLIEKRALQVSSDTAGGYLVSGGIMNEILRVERQQSIMRMISRVLDPLEGIDEIGVPSEEAAIADASWVTEITIGGEDSSASFGRKTLHPHPISKLIKVGQKLLRSASNAEDYVIEALGNAVATPQESAFIEGSGSGEPLGLLNTSGLPVYTTSASGGVSGDDIRKWIFSLPALYQERARILTSTDFMRHLMTLKDGDGQYLFNLERGQILGKPVVLSDGMPSGIVDSSDNLVGGQYAAIVGDFRYFWIADAAGAVVQRLAELYAEANETGFIIWQETDGMCVLPAAFYALQIST
jgi:HK97 family phage major capsid protein